MSTSAVVICGLVILIIIIIIVLVAWLISGSQVVVYYKYPNDQHIQEGIFGEDPVVFSSRLIEAYSDVNLTQKTGYIQTQVNYLTYPQGNQMFMNKLMNVSLGQNIYTIMMLYTYTANPPAKPDVYDFSHSYVLSSNNGHVGNKVSIVNVQGDLYQLIIN